MNCTCEFCETKQQVKTNFAFAGNRRRCLRLLKIRKRTRRRAQFVKDCCTVNPSQQLLRPLRHAERKCQVHLDAKASVRESWPEPGPCCALFSSASFYRCTSSLLEFPCSFTRSFRKILPRCTGPGFAESCFSFARLAFAYAWRARNGFRMALACSLRTIPVQQMRLQWWVRYRG